MPTPASFYRQVDVHLHGDTKFLALTPETPSGRGLFKHLLICPELGPLPGVIRSGAAAMAEVLEWPLDSFLERFEELVREGLVEVDWKARLIFLPNGIQRSGQSQPGHWLGTPLECPARLRPQERHLGEIPLSFQKRRRETAQRDPGWDKRQTAKPGSAPQGLPRKHRQARRRPVRRGAGIGTGTRVGTCTHNPPVAGAASTEDSLGCRATPGGDSARRPRAGASSRPPARACRRDRPPARAPPRAENRRAPRRRHRRSTRNPKPHPVRASRAPCRLVRCLGRWSQPSHEPRQLDQQATMLARAAAGTTPQSHRHQSLGRPTQRSGRKAPGNR
jgi:hypothetical protein